MLFFRFGRNVIPGLVRAEFAAQPVHQPHAHDVFLVPVVADAAFIGIIGGFTACVDQRLRRLDAQQAPGAGGNVEFVSLHGDAFHGASRIVCGAEHDFDSLIFPDHRTRLLQRQEQAFRKFQRADDLRIVFPGFGAYHAAGGGVGVLMALYAAEFIHQVFRDHQEIGDALQPTGHPVRIQLIDRIEGLELDACAPVKFREGDLPMDFRDGGFGPAVPVSVAGQDRPAVADQDIINAPGIDGKAFDPPVFLHRFFNACADMHFQRGDVPGQVPVLFRDPVGKTVNFISPDFTVFLPSDDMPAGGSADINGEKIFHMAASGYLSVQHYTL